MRLQKYLTERILSPGEIEIFQENYPQLYKDCKLYIDDWRKSGAKDFLYRGTRRPGIYFGIKSSHVKSGRLAKDTSQETHNILNDLFKKRFKWYVRNGVMTTGNISDASSYGTVYLFFPIGKYKFVWSPKVDDLYSEIDVEYKHMYSFDEYYGSDIRYDWEEEYGKDRKGHWEYDGEEIDNTEDLRYELEDTEEDFDKDLLYWIPDMDYDEYESARRGEYEKEREDYFFDLVKKYTDKNLRGAINSGNEVIFNCDKYYLVDINYEEMLMKAIYKK